VISCAKVFKDYLYGLHDQSVARPPEVAH
jgi:hypothetical protein